jgi:hypothetical protein
VLLIDFQQLLDQSNRFDDKGKGRLIPAVPNQPIELLHNVVGLLEVLESEVALREHQAELTEDLILE